MQIFTPDEVEDDILNDLLEEINELYEATEQTLIELEIQPQDNELQRALFRSVHTIKGDLGLVSFTPLIPLLQHVEDLLDYLRKGQISYSSVMNDLVLLTMDRVKSFVESVMHTGKAEYDGELYQHLVTAIARIRPDNSALHDKLLAEAVLLLDPKLDLQHHLESPEVTATTPSSPTTKPVATIGQTGIPKDLSAEKQMDILFFRDLMKTIERRSNYWVGRGDRIAKLALFINDLAGKKIPEDQLVVACYVHDFGMAFLPLKLLHKQDSLSEMEYNLMRSHVYKSTRLLEHLEQWDEARKIVIQHHERCDGSGYPLGLREPEISDGAKLLALLDSFDAMTHSRANSKVKRLSKKQAVVALNRAANGQFCAQWLTTFNHAMAKLLS